MRLFFEKKDFYPNRVVLTDALFHHLSRVRRIQSGEIVTIVVSHTCYKISVKSLDRHHLFFDTISEVPPRPNMLELTLVQCIPKGSKMQDIIHNVTQLGVSRIIPVLSHRSIVQWDKTKQLKLVDKWSQIALSSAQQSEQDQCPTVSPILTFSSFMPTFNPHDYDVCILPWESESDHTLKSVLNNMRLSQHKSAAIFIGPEGGITRSEHDALVCNGFKSVSLGPHIYRTEMAGIVTISQLIYALSN